MGKRGRNKLRAAALELATLLDASLLAAQIAQVVQLRTADAAAAGDLDGLEVRGVNREGTLYADTEGNLAHGEGLADTGALAADADALEELCTLVVTLNNLDVDVEGIAGAEGRDVVAQLCCIDLVDNVGHTNIPFQFGTEDPSGFKPDRFVPVT